MEALIEISLLVHVQHEIITKYVYLTDTAARREVINMFGIIYEEHSCLPSLILHAIYHHVYYY